MRITLTPSNPPTPGESAGTVQPSVTVEHPYDDLNALEAVQLVKQALLAWGFSESTIRDYFAE